LLLYCRAWRDGKAPSSAAGIAIADAHGGGGALFCPDENDAPNNESPRKVRSPKKRGEKRKSPSRGLGIMVLNPLPSPSPPSLQPTRSITPPPPSQCRGVSEGFFGPALTFAAKSMEHTANQLMHLTMHEKDAASHAGPGGMGKLRRVQPASRSPMLTEAAALRFAPMRTMRRTRSLLVRLGVQKRGGKRESLSLEA